MSSVLRFSHEFPGDPWSVRRSRKVGVPRQERSSSIHAVPSVGAWASIDHRRQKN